MPASSSSIRALRAGGVACVLVLVLALGPSACAKGSKIDATSSAHEGAGSGGAAGHGGHGGAASNGVTAGTASASGGAAGTASASGGAAGSGGGFVASACAPGEFATGLDQQDKLACVPIAPLARDAVNKGCSLYLGWRDNCTGCTLDPTKWGHTSPAGCVNGTGVNDTCTTPVLGGTAINLFGLNFDGDVNDDDKTYLGLDCPAGDAATSPGPCGAGTLATGIAAGGETTCVSAATPVLDHVRTSCSLYFGWRDSCDACTTAPARWGRVSPTDCAVGLADPSTCTTPVLGGETVQMFGLSTGGDVDDNDKLYLALHCEDPVAATAMTKDACPQGQFITGVAADGTLTCESPAQAVAAYFDAHCTFYFGWQDSCSGCTNPPAKWGRVRNGFCMNDVGVNDTCAPTALDGKTLQMFGLNPDGNVDDNDTLYVGFQCD
jgi:hypothetical protein